MRINIFTTWKDKVKNLIKNESSLVEIVRKEKKTNKELTRVLTQRHEPLWIPSLRSFLIIASIVLFFAVLSHPQVIIKYFINPLLYLFERMLGDLSAYQSIKSFLKELVSNLPSINIPPVKTEHNHYQNFIAVHVGIGSVLIGLAFFVA